MNNYIGHLLLPGHGLLTSKCRSKISKGAEPETYNDLLTGQQPFFFSRIDKSSK